MFLLLWGTGGDQGPSQQQLSGQAGRGAGVCRVLLALTPVPPGSSRWALQEGGGSPGGCIQCEEALIVPVAQTKGSLHSRVGKSVILQPTR